MDLLQKMSWVPRLTTDELLCSCYRGKGCGDARLRFCWMWELSLFLPCAEPSQVIALLLTFLRELLQELLGLPDPPLRARCALGASPRPEEQGCSVAAPCIAPCAVNA